MLSLFIRVAIEFFSLLLYIWRQSFVVSYVLIQVVDYSSFLLLSEEAQIHEQHKPGRSYNQGYP